MPMWEWSNCSIQLSWPNALMILMTLYWPLSDKGISFMAVTLWYNFIQFSCWSVGFPLQRPPLPLIFFLLSTCIPICVLLSLVYVLRFYVCTPLRWCMWYQFMLLLISSVANQFGVTRLFRAVHSSVVFVFFWISSVVILIDWVVLHDQLILAIVIRLFVCSFVFVSVSIVVACLASSRRG